MPRRRGVRSASSSSRQLGGRDARHRRNNQIEAVHGRSSSTVDTAGGKLDVRLGSGLQETEDGVAIKPAASVSNASSAGEVQDQLNALLASLRAAGILED